MKKYDVTITERLQMIVQVSADSREEAEAIVEAERKMGRYVLNADHFIDVDFKAAAHSRNKNFER